MVQAGSEMIPVPNRAISFCARFLGRPKAADKNLQAHARVPPLEKKQDDLNNGMC